jgi:hypothetical protein
MALIPKLRRILKAAFPPPDKISLRDEDRIIVVVTSNRFRNLEMMDRQTLLEDTLRTHGLSREEMRRILLLVAVTPEEEQAHTAAK